MYFSSLSTKQRIFVSSLKQVYEILISILNTPTLLLTATKSPIPNVIDEKLNLFSSVKKSTAKDDFDLLTKELLGIKVIKNK